MSQFAIDVENFTGIVNVQKERRIKAMPTIESRVKDIIASQATIDAADLNDETVLMDDLGLDSLDMVELAMAIEEEFQGEIEDEEAAKIKTVGDMVKCAEEKVAAGKWRWTE